MRLRGEAYSFNALDVVAGPDADALAAKGVFGVAEILLTFNPLYHTTASYALHQLAVKHAQDTGRHIVQGDACHPRETWVVRLDLGMDQVVQLCGLSRDVSKRERLMYLARECDRA